MPADNGGVQVPRNSAEVFMYSGVKLNGGTSRGASREWIRVPGALVACSAQNLFGFWKSPTMPCHVCEIGIEGLSFRNFGERLEPGSRVKMCILLPKHLPVTVIGTVSWNKPPPPEAGNRASRHTDICGVKFDDYGAEAWGVLCELESAYGPETSAAAKASPA